MITLCEYESTIENYAIIGLPGQTPHGVSVRKLGGLIFLATYEKLEII